MENSTTRQEIKNEIAQCYDKMIELQNTIAELKKKDMLLCDKEQWFKEENEEHEELIKVEGKRNRQKIKRTYLIGRVWWYQDFIDDDNPDTPVTITRSRVVRVNGEWQ